MNKENALTAVVVVLGACAVIMTAANIRRQFFPPPTEPGKVVSDWASYGELGHRVGASLAQVTIVAFTDYECPFCTSLEERLSALYEQHPTELAIVWRHFPLEGHERALKQAHAAVCADDQGRFEVFHRLLFDRSAAPESASLSQLAAAAGIRDSAGFEECLASELPTTIVERDRLAADRLGVVATPTIMVDSVMYVGAPHDLERIVSRHIEYEGAR